MASVLKRILQKQRPQCRKTSPPEDSFCSLGTKHDRRTAPKPKLFAPVTRLQEQRPQLQKTVLGSSPDEDGFSSLETKHNRTVQRTKLFVLARSQELQSQTQKLPWVQVLEKMLGLGIIIVFL
jgi:hypothetical protein